jgi:hypothetical protein
MNKFYLYIKKDDELGEIIEKIRETPEKDIVLVIPSGTKSLSHPINLEILKKEIDNTNKNVYLSTDDEKIATLARKSGIQLFLDDIERHQIVDIIPPSVFKKETKKEVKFIKKEIKSSSKKLNIFSLFKHLIFYLVVFVFIFGASFIIWQFLQARAELEIETEKTNFDINEVITLKENQINADLENKILPAKYVKIEVSKTESLTTTGPFLSTEKPLLEIAFLNFSNEEIPLVAGTRVEYQENIFRTTERIVLPSATNSEPSQVNVSVIPDSLKNDQLFIPSNTPLIIPALEGKKRDDGSLWTDVIKAKTLKDYDLRSLSSSVRSVAPEDITNVKLNLEKSLKEDIAFKLRTEYLDSFYIYDPSLVKIEIGDVSHQVGAKTDKIYALGKATFETLITTKKEFDSFIRNLINKEILAQSKNLVITNLDLEKEEILDFDSKKKTMTVGIKGKAILGPEINPEVIKEEIRGKTIEEVNAYFSNFSGIKKIKLKIFPQWQDKIPQDHKKIKIKVL